MTLEPSPQWLWLAAVCVSLAYVAHHDFWNFRIKNKAVLWLIGLYIPWTFVHGMSTATLDFMAACILFFVTFMAWLPGWIGGGDVKLYFALGLLVGFEALPLFCALLAVFSFIFVAATFLAMGSSSIANHLRAMRRSRHLPYGVPMCLAAALALLWRTGIP